LRSCQSCRRIFARLHGRRGTLFEELGFYYVGPIDGHNLDHLLPVLKNVRDMEPADPGPCRHPKGQGLSASGSLRPTSITPSLSSTWRPARRAKAKPNAPAYQNVFGQSLVKEAQKDDKIVGITAPMPSGTGIGYIRQDISRAHLRVGIAEQHAVRCGGLAPKGYKAVLRDLFDLPAARL